MNKFGLSKENYKLFSNVHNRHLNSWESYDRQVQHGEPNIKSVTIDTSQRAFMVKYKATDKFEEEMYYYDPIKMTWW